MPEEDFFLNDQPIEKVATIKFLGMWVTSAGFRPYHMENKILAAKAESNNLSKIGYMNKKLKVEAKGLLTQSFIRSKLLYAAEIAGYPVSSIEKLQRCEGNIIERSLHLPKRSYTTPLYSALGINSLEEAVQKRKICFVTQLLSNDFTKQILLPNRKHGAMKYCKL